MPVEQNDKTLTLKLGNGDSAEIYWFGATVTSWKSGGKERLFLSEKAHLDGSAAIRGGIPVVFPIFGPPPSSPPEYAALKQHGFARTQTWSLEKVLADGVDAVSVQLLAPPPPASFGHAVALRYVVTLRAGQLANELVVDNTSGAEFKFQALLHNYIRVSDIGAATVQGIDAGVPYADKLLGGQVSPAPGGPLAFASETDRVYRKLPNRDLVLNDAKGDDVKVSFTGFEDCTIWNPAEVSGSKMGDMEAGGWNRYVCVEPGYVSEFKTIRPGEKSSLHQTLTVA